MKLFITIFSMLVYLLSFSDVANAQQCEIIPEEIVRLKEPVFDTPMVWDSIYGGDGMERFTDIIPLDDGNFVIAGDYTKDENDTTFKPLLIGMDARGRELWRNEEEQGSSKSIHTILDAGKSYIALGDITDAKRGKGLFLSRYSKQGKRQSIKTFFEKNVDLEARSIVFADNGKSLIIAAQAKSKTDDIAHYGLAVKMTLSGKKIWRRAYQPGMETFFNTLEPLKDGSFMAGGKISVSDGRLAGWLVRIDSGGAIMWQRSYPRGSDASIDTLKQLADSSFVVGGSALPVHGNWASAWLMKVDSNGAVLWQRYYAGSLEQSIPDLTVDETGRVSVLLSAKKINYNQRAHVRLMTFTPRGYLLDVNSFTDGQGARSSRLVLGKKKERLVVGYAQTKLPDRLDPEAENLSTFDGWVFAATALDPYLDPCLPRPFMP